MTDKGWYELHKHAVYDIYGLGNSLALKHTAIPLYKRMKAIWDYILDDSLSFWRTADYKGLTIGAQDYLGGVVESDRDAMKNSDIGASWMLASMTGDPRLTEERLPFMRNFKLMQQAPADDPNYGAAMGQYYLWKKKKFVEEWGDHIEPIGITYYTLMDLGNILLFERDDSLLRNSFQAGAERLLSLQQADGGFAVAYGKPRRETAVHRPARPSPHVLRLRRRLRTARRTEIPRCRGTGRRLVRPQRRGQGSLHRRLRRRAFHQ